MTRANRFHPPTSRRAALAGLGAAAALPWLPRPALAAPEAELWPRWEAHTPESTVEPDHGPWGAFLESYLKPGPDGVNRVAYGAVSEGDRAALQDYLDALAGAVPGDMNRDAQFAYWVNLYNALTVATVVDHHPVESIRDIDISPGWFSDGPWGKKLIAVDGADLSLDDIEHRILRPIWRDPRVHYAVNCASIGCPNLRPEPFTAANKETVLEAAARDYVNHPRGARVANGKLRVSSIYIWFQADFGGDDTGVISHLKRYADPGLKAALDRVDGIAGHDYDWSLNGTGFEDASVKERGATAKV